MCVLFLSNKRGDYRLGLFSINKPKAKKKESLTDIIDKTFEDVGLRNGLRDYLKTRRAHRNVPSIESWKVQLKLLQKVPECNRIKQVHNAIDRGWRAVAFENSYSSNKTYNSEVTRKKVDKRNIVEQCF